MIAEVASQRTGATKSNSTTWVQAFPGNVTAGNLITVQIEKWTNTVSDVPVLGDISKTDGTATLGAWTLDKAYEVSLNGGTQYWSVAIWSAPVTGTGSCTVTVTTATAYGAIGVTELSGADTTTSRVADSQTGTGTSAAPATANATSTADAAFVGALGFQCTSIVSITPDAAFTQIYEEENGAAEQTGAFEIRVVSSGTTDAASWTLGESDPWLCAVAVYKGAAAAALKATQLTEGTETLAEYTGTTGTVAIDTSVARQSGVAWVKCSGSASNGGGFAERSGVYTNPGRSSRYYRLDNLPDAGGVMSLASFRQNNTTVCFWLGVDSAGVLRLYTGSFPGTQLGSNGPTLSTGTPYRLAVSWSLTSTTVYTIKVWVYDTSGASLGSDISVTNGSTLTSATIDMAREGMNLSAAQGGTRTVYFQHFVSDDGSGLDDIGDVRTTAKLPNATNTNEFDTGIGSGTNRYDRVKERPISETNGWQDATPPSGSVTRAPTSDENTTSAFDGSQGTRYQAVDDYPDTTPTDTLTCTGGAGGGQITFGFSAFSIPAGSTGITVLVDYYDDEASTGNNNAGGRLKVGGNYYNSSTHNPSTTQTQRTDTWATNPKTTLAWTVDDINGVGANALQAFGLNSTDANPSWFFTSIQVRVTYTPPASANAVENYGVESASQGDVDITGKTLLGWTAWAWAKSGGTSGGGEALFDNGNERSISLTTTSTLFSYVNTSASYPSNAAACGLRATSGASDSYLYECGIVIAYIAQIVTTQSPTKAGLYRLQVTRDTQQKTGQYRALLANKDVSKAGEFRVILGSTPTKSALYRLQAALETTKAGLYRLIAQAGDLTKDAAYRIIAAVGLDKAAEYVITTTGTWDITRSALYRLLAAVSPTKIAQYRLWQIDQAIQRSALYRLLMLASPEKAAMYAITTFADLAKDAGFLILTSPAPQKAGQYQLLVSQEISKTGVYRILAAVTIQKSAAYFLEMVSSPTKAGQYRLLATASPTKDGEYQIAGVSTYNITKTGLYRLLGTLGQEKTAIYRIARLYELETLAGYRMQAATDVARAGQYRVLATISSQKAGEYRTAHVQDLGRSAAYWIGWMTPISRPGQYRVHAAHDVAKSAQYVIGTTVAIHPRMEELPARYAIQELGARYAIDELPARYRINEFDR